jgi:hypothetical protein
MGGGLPLAAVSIPLSASLQNSGNGGDYCPTSVDDSGRYKYAPVAYESGKSGTLHFLGGKWCLGTDCSEVSGTLLPVRRAGANFSVTPCSDFDGLYALSDGPLVDYETLTAEGRTRRPIPTREPPAPIPEGVDWTAEMPKYDKGCVVPLTANESAIYSKFTEGGQKSALEYEDDGYAGLSEKKHPCKAKKERETSAFEEIWECEDREGARGIAQAKVDYGYELYNHVIDLAAANANFLICSRLPDPPPGFPAPGDVCEGIVEYYQAGSASVNGGVLAKYHYDVAKASDADCSQVQMGLSRLFCDIFCVRDATIRGDRAILHNLELATKIVKDNMKAFFDWSNKENNKGFDYAVRTVRNLGVSVTNYLKSICAKTESCPDAAAALLDGGDALIESMVSDLSSFARSASLHAPSRKTALGALDRYVTAAVQLNDSVRQVDDAKGVMSQIVFLHSTLRKAGSRSKLESIEAQASMDAHQLQQRARSQIRQLGIYRHFHNASKTDGRAWQRALLDAAQVYESLVQIDKLLWPLRTSLDAYFDAAEDELEAYQVAFKAFDSFKQCGMSKPALMEVYHKSMAAKNAVGRQLTTTWKKSTSLLGETAAIVEDGGIFEKLMAAGGCNSSMVTQTMQQLDHAFSSVAFLHSRFKVAGFPEPDMQPVEQAAARVDETFAAAEKRCRV